MFPRHTHTTFILTVTAMFSSHIAAAQDGAFKAANGKKAPETPAFFDTNDKRPKEVAPQTSYSVSSHPNTGIFFLDGEKGYATYTWPVFVGNQAIYLMYRHELEFVGSDKTGRYWHYRLLLLGGLHWCVPKNVSGTEIPMVWYKVDAPGTQFVPFGVPTMYPINIQTKTKNSK